MNINTIRAKYHKAIDRHGDLISADAAELLIDLALDDINEAIAAAGSQLPDRTDLSRWLEQNAPEHYARYLDATVLSSEHNTARYLDAAALATLIDQRAALHTATLELAAAIAERDAADRDASFLEQAAVGREEELAQIAEDLHGARMELANLIDQRDGLQQQLAALDADNAQLLRELNLLRKQNNAVQQTDETEHSGLTVADINYDAAFIDEVAKWEADLNRSVRTFRKAPRHIRLEIARRTIEQLKTQSIPPGEPPTQDYFDARKPKWMPQAVWLSKSLELSWPELCSGASNGASNND